MAEHSDITPITPDKVTPDAVRAMLGDGLELALIDVREEGVFLKGHLFWAACIPLSHLELRIRALVPRFGTRIVLCDGGDIGGGSGLAEAAAAKLTGFGYTDVALLEGGTKGWADAGGELFTGVNVPSKAFGEFVEHEYETPRVSAPDLKQMVERGDQLVILDSRPENEFTRMSIPGGIDVPGAELVHRVHDLAPDPETLVVVNCAGRTRSIIGAQSLINANIPNKVMALKDGTMGWELAGFDCANNSDAIGPPPSPEGLRQAQARAAEVAARFGVRKANADQLSQWQAEADDKSLYLLDVRTVEEFEAGHVAGARHAPGGQLVQSTDEFMATRNARVVLVDTEDVRAVMTASWLIQLGWPEVWVLNAAEEKLPQETGQPERTIPGFELWGTITIGALQGWMTHKETVILDLSSSLSYRRRHIPGAGWGVRSRLSEAVAHIPDGQRIILTGSDEKLCHLTGQEAWDLWPNAEVKVLRGGNRAWIDAGLPIEEGMTYATTDTDDVWYKPYDFGDTLVEEKAKEYLNWEVALVDQIKRDGTVAFKKFD